MGLEERVKGAAKSVIEEEMKGLKTKLILIGAGVVAGLLLVMTPFFAIGGAASENDGSYTGSNSGLTGASTSLIDYLLNFGGDSTTYEIDGRKFYKTYDDTIGYLTVGLDVYIDGKREGFEVPGYVSDTINGPSKYVDNVYDYAMSKFSSGITILIEKELCDKNAEEIRDEKMARVDNLERELGTTFSMQQRYALCAVYYRRSRNVRFYSGMEECK